MPKTIHSKIRGVTQQNDDGISRQKIIKKYVESDTLLMLERERSNRYDPNAIAVHALIDDDNFDSDDTIGYLSKELAEELAPVLDSGGDISCYATEVTGGTGGDSLGVNIELMVYSPEEAAQKKAERAAAKPAPAMPKQAPSAWSQVRRFLPKKITRKMVIWGIILLILVCSFCSYLVQSIRN